MFGSRKRSQTYDYDPYGNGWVSQSTLALSPLTPVAQSWYDTATNRIVGVAYDPSGNQQRVSPFTMSYDAENWQIQAVQDVTGYTHTYAYDGEGRRVKKVATGRRRSTSTMPLATWRRNPAPRRTRTLERGT